MPVNLSPVGGAAVQFFTSNGVPLAGGKLYSYAAGTTTPQATYTSSSGGTAWSNPIVLDSAGRVSGGGEIWLTGNLEYKFILKDSTDVLIGTYDNIRGIGDTTVLLAFEALLAGSTGSSLVGFLQSGTSAVATTVQAKLRESVSVLDFGADPTGATDSSIAFQAAGATGKTIFVPKGLYQASFGLRNGQIIFGEGARNQSRIIPPVGATYVIAVAANSLGTASKQHCQIRDLSIENTNAVANCTGIFFSAVDATGINDNHFVENVYISGFLKGVYVTGRLILTTMINVEITTCTIAFHVISDPANYAFNLNTFIMCRYVDSIQEGVNITGYNIANKFISCNVEGNNTANAVGVAGMFVQNAEGLFLDNPYFELNGGATAVDTINPLNNSIGLYLAGARCFNLRVTNGWMVQSGTMIAVNVSAGIVGGEISGVRFAPLSTGFDVYVGDKLANSNSQPIIIDSNNYFSGQMSVKTDGAGLTSAAVRQTAACQFVPAAATLDLRSANKFAVFNAAGFNLTTITNRIPGMEMKIFNSGAGTVTIDATLMQSGVASSIVTGASKTYMVLGYPNVGKFVTM